MCRETDYPEDHRSKAKSRNDSSDKNLPLPPTSPNSNTYSESENLSAQPAEPPEEQSPKNEQLPPTSSSNQTPSSPQTPPTQNTSQPDPNTHFSSSNESVPAPAPAPTPASQTPQQQNNDNIYNIFTSKPKSEVKSSDPITTTTKLEKKEDEYTAYEYVSEYVTQDNSYTDYYSVT